MNYRSTQIPYFQTGFFSKFIIDYLNNSDTLKNLFNYFPNKQGIELQINERLKYKTDRTLLTIGLKKQYENTELSEATKNNIELINKASTFTVTTAHQPNIFTGPLYFIYKILHTIKLAAYCKEAYPHYDFVPVYYMGSEDADLDELGQFYLNNEKLTWVTKQTGAVGRMIVDSNFLQLIDRIESELGVYEHSTEIITILRTYYRLDENIQTATLRLVNELFGQYGLVIVVPDNPLFKSIAIDLFKDELLSQNSSKIVEKTAQLIQEQGYKAQAYSREINLFYLHENSRRRIIRNNNEWLIHQTNQRFSTEQILTEVNTHPERFSPNVILRGLFQEMLLPNIAFIGGGGELAYWLQLKGIFDFYKTPYPALVLRNSFLFIDKKNTLKIEKLGIGLSEIFLPIKDLQNKWVNAQTQHHLNVGEEINTITNAYNGLSTRASAIDSTLKKHVNSLKIKATKRIEELGKKMLRAEKRNHSEAMKQIETVKGSLFPLNNLQERVDNFIPYYAKYGKEFIEILYRHSFAIEQQFVILQE